MKRYPASFIPRLFGVCLSVGFTQSCFSGLVTTPYGICDCYGWWGDGYVYAWALMPSPFEMGDAPRHQVWEIVSGDESLLLRRRVLDYVSVLWGEPREAYEIRRDPTARGLGPPTSAEMGTGFPVILV